jgi:hypothetical protein
VCAIGLICLLREYRASGLLHLGWHLLINLLACLEGILLHDGHLLHGKLLLLLHCHGLLVDGHDPLLLHRANMHGGSRYHLLLHGHHLLVLHGQHLLLHGHPLDGHHLLLHVLYSALQDFLHQTSYDLGFESLNVHKKKP